MERGEFRKGWEGKMVVEKFSWRRAEGSVGGANERGGRGGEGGRESE
jgi:hypothetical protein